MDRWFKSNRGHQFLKRRGMIMDHNGELQTKWDYYQRLCRDHGAHGIGDLIVQRDELLAALHCISLGSQNSQTSKETLGREARAAIEEAKKYESVLKDGCHNFDDGGVCIICGVDIEDAYTNPTLKTREPVTTTKNLKETKMVDAQSLEIKIIRLEQRVQELETEVAGIKSLLTKVVLALEKLTDLAQG